MDISLSVPLTQGKVSADICLRVDPKDNKDDLCLGFYDEDKKEWICEDECLERNPAGGKNELCGRTDHFTNFAVLLVGGRGVNGNKCGSSGAFYITGEWRGDAGLVGGIVLVFILAAFVIILLSYVPALRPYYLGAEGNRMNQARRVSRDW